MLDELLDFSEGATWAALALAILGGFGAFVYAEFLGTGANLFIRILSAVATFFVGYIVAFWILTR